MRSYPTMSCTRIHRTSTPCKQQRRFAESTFRLAFRDNSLTVVFDALTSKMYIGASTAQALELVANNRKYYRALLARKQPCSMYLYVHRVPLMLPG
jgi:dTDP-4-dehydrorhamnose reductase